MQFCYKDRTSKNANYVKIVLDKLALKWYTVFVVEIQHY